MWLSTVIAFEFNGGDGGDDELGRGITPWKPSNGARYILLKLERSLHGH